MEPALSAISTQAAQMRKCLDTPGRLMASLKHATLMLAELREEIPPKEYYYRYSACFDALSQLATFLKDIHTSHHLADIYENVQYATYAVPRLYLMVTVGSAFMSIPDAPVNDILQDMLDMCRGVQNPLRGLFLRYYLAQRVREYLPQMENVNDSVKFVMTNFVEMNKLWVRMQHVGPSNERQKRAAERKELQTIVGFNVERLAYLNLTIDYFSERVFPPLAQQIIHCRDPLAQEYLLDVICSAFPAEFHLGTLDAYLAAVELLSPSTSLPKVLLLSIDRLTQYIENEMPEMLGDKQDTNTNSKQDTTEETQQNGEAANVHELPKEANSEADDLKSEDQEHNDETKGELEDKTKEETTESEEPQEPKETVSEDAKDKKAEPKDVPEPEREYQESGDASKSTNPEYSSSSRSLTPPTDTLPDIRITFDTYRSHLNSLKERLNHGQRAQIAKGLARLAFLLDTNDIERVHELLMFVEGESGVPDSSIVDLLLDLLDYIPLLDVIGFGTFKRLLSSQDRQGQQALANKVLQVIILKTGTAITDYNVAKQIFDLFGLITKSGNMDALRLSELVYLLQAEDIHEGTRLLQLAHSSLRQGGVNVVQQTYGALVTCATKLVRANESDSSATLFKFIGKVVNDLAVIGSQPDKAFRLYLFAAAVADQVGAQEASYEYYVQAFSLYEEHISDSRAQYQAICIITGSLQKTRRLGAENYDTLAGRCAQYGQKLLKKADQCRAIYMAAHLWYVEEGDTVFYSNDAKVLETLQRALRVADACMDAALSVELFVEVLNRFLYFLEREAGDVTERHVNGLIDLINSNLTQTEDEATSESPRKYFERTLAFIESGQPSIPAFSQLTI